MRKLHDAGVLSDLSPISRSPISPVQPFLSWLRKTAFRTNAAVGQDDKAVNNQNGVEADISNEAVGQDEKEAKEKHDAVQEQNGVEAGISNAAVGQDEKEAKEKHDADNEFYTPNQSFEDTEPASQPALASEEETLNKMATNQPTETEPALAPEETLTAQDSAGAESGRMGKAAMATNTETESALAPEEKLTETAQDSAGADSDRIVKAAIRHKKIKKYRQGSRKSTRIRKTQHSKTSKFQTNLNSTKMIAQTIRRSKRKKSKEMTIEEASQQ